MEKELTENQKKEKSYSDSINEGVNYSASQGLGNTLITPLAESIRSSATQIGFISALSGIISPLAQIYGNKLMERNSRKNIVKTYAITEAFSWILISLIPVMFILNIFTSYLPWFLILFYSFVAISFGLTYPAFFGVLGDIIPENKRGSYIARRDKHAVIASTVTSIAGSLIMQQSTEFGIIFIGFSIAFFLAFIFRIISYMFIERMYFPFSDFRLEVKDKISFLEFIKNKSNYRKFAIAQAFLNFALFVATPFFGLYMLRDLGLKDNLFLFVLISMSPAIFSALFAKSSGKISDKYGNVLLFYISAAFFVLSPIVWLISTNIFWLIFATGVIAGIANSAYTVAVSNFTYDSVPREKRGEYIAYANILAGIGVFVGSLVGGILIDNMSKINVTYNPYMIVFLLAAALRLLVTLIFFRNINEVKKVKEFPNLFKIPPVKAFNQELHYAGAFMHHHLHVPLIKFKNNRK